MGTREYDSLSYGSHGDSVKILQELLNKNGYKLDVDGIYGDKTQSAVEQYQAANNLQVDGFAGNETWNSLMGGIKTNATNNTVGSGFNHNDFNYKLI